MAVDVEVVEGSSNTRWDGPILEIEDLNVSFSTEEGTVSAVRGVSFEVHADEILGIVGESGSGKSVSMLAAFGLLPKSATVTGSARFKGEELLGAKNKTVRRLRGDRMAMIFQDPLTALNPVHKVGDQVGEAIMAHQAGLTRREIDARAVEMLDLVGIPQPDTRAKQYPHEFSGGMRQRAMIAMAVANDPDLIVADEPTTALDVTIQAQVLEVLQGIQQRTNAAIVFITHDLGVIAQLAHRVQVMYAGRAAEVASVDDMFFRPLHPYTKGLLASVPNLDTDGSGALRPIPGSPPSMLRPPPGCAFHPRCPRAVDRCRQDQPALREIEVGHVSACHFAEDLQAEHDAEAAR